MTEKRGEPDMPEKAATDEEILEEATSIFRKIAYFIWMFNRRRTR